MKKKIKNIISRTDNFFYKFFGSDKSVKSLQNIHEAGKIFSCLNQDSKEDNVRFVGGCVRKALCGDEIDDLMTLCEADITTKNKFLKDKYLNNFKLVREKIKVVEERDRVRNFQPPITGEEIMNHFNIKPCKEIGQIKNFIKESILNGDIENSYKQAYNLMIEKGRELGLEND